MPGKKLIIVILRPAATFGASIGQDTNDSHVFSGEERQHSIIEQISLIGHLVVYNLTAAHLE